MTNKSKMKKKVQNQRARKPTPFADAGQIAGQGLGKMFNIPYLGGIGKWLGSGIGQIFGSGDYQMVGASPNYNVLTSSRQIPKFSSGERTNIVCHREYLGDLQGTTAFTNRAYPLNPGIAKTFPWLSTVATNYSQYRFHGVIFEFRPLITDFVTGGAPGVIVLATNYNADRAVYRSKVEMENSEYAVSVKPTNNMIHGVECATNETPIDKLYVRSGPPLAGEDLRLYDLGVTQVATQGNPTQLLGELWVSYCVEFFKPLLPEDIGKDADSVSITRATYTDASPLGLIGVQVAGDLDVIVAPTTITVPQSVRDGIYSLNIIWSADVAVALVMPVITYSSGIVGVNYLFTQTVSYFANENASVIRRVFMQAYFRLTHSDTGSQMITFGGAGTLPTGNTQMAMVISRVDDLAE